MAGLRDLPTGLGELPVPLPVPEPPRPETAEAPHFAPGLWPGPLARLAELGPAPSLIVLKLDHAGDFVTALPALRRLREAFPASRLSLLCAPFTRDLAASTGLFDRIDTLDYYPARGHPPDSVPDAAMAALRALDLPPVDIALDLRHADDARALLLALPARFRVGFAGLSARHALDLALPEMESSARNGGLLDPLPAGVRLSALAEVLVSAVRSVQAGFEGPLGAAGPPLPLDFPGGYVVLAPGARLAIKHWPPAHWQVLAGRILADTALGLVLTGTAEEQALCEAIAGGLPHGRVACLAGSLDLPGLAAVVRGARAVVGLDSATAHLGAALGRPTVCLFSGLADIHSWAPVGPRVAVVSAQASCAPCFLRDVAECPHAHGCMTHLTPDHALAGLAALGLEGIREGGGLEGGGLEFAGVPLHERGMTRPIPTQTLPRPEGSGPDSAAVTVVFVTYNSSAVIGRAVASVPSECPVVVVDNASPEGTPWAAALARPVDLVAMPVNAGFGTACNTGARRAETPHVLFLNPDAVLEPDTIPRLLAAARLYGEPAILMPAIVGENGRLMRKEGSILEKVPRSARLAPEEIAGDYCTRFVHGAAFMVSRAAFLELGGFDEAIFLYHEDDDLSLRALARRIPIVVVTEARVTHAGGRSSTPSFGQTFRINRAKMHSELYVREKYGAAGGRASRLVWLGAGCALALALFDLHRVAIRAGKFAGCLDGVRRNAPPHV